jgi:hypothetical protein
MSSTIPPKASTPPRIRNSSPRYFPINLDEEKEPTPIPPAQNTQVSSQPAQNIPIHIWNELEKLRELKEELERHALLKRLTESSERQEKDDESLILASFEHEYEGSSNKIKTGTWKTEHNFKSTEKNYYPWLSRIMQFLRQRNLDLLAQGKIVPSEKWSLASLRRYQIDMEFVRNALIQSVDDLVVQATNRSKHPHEILEYMKTTYADDTEIQKQNLMHEMSNLHYEEGAPIEDHFAKYQILMNKMINAGMEYSEQRKINCFLDTLPTTWRVEKRSYLSKLSTLHEVLAQAKGTAADMMNEKMYQEKGKGVNQVSQALLALQEQIEAHNVNVRSGRIIENFNISTNEQDRMRSKTGVSTVGS